MLSDLWIRFRALFRRNTVEAELDEELRLHCERQAEKYVQAGLTREEALRRARLEFGGVEQVKEECRDARGVQFVETLAQDLRYGLRQLRKSPGFTAVAVLTLALGIGANTAIFSIINAIALRPLPVRRPAQLVMLHWSARHGPHTRGHSEYGQCVVSDFSDRAPAGCSFSYPMFQQLAAQRSVFGDVFAMVSGGQFGISGLGTASVTTGQYVSGEFFPALGIRAAFGRLLTPQDDRTGAAPVAVLSYAYWRSRFGGDAGIIGKSVLMDHVPVTVIGIAPRGFEGLDPGVPHALWLPFSARAQISAYDFVHERAAREWPDTFYLLVLARLRPDVSLERAQAIANVVFTRGVTTGANAPFKPIDAPQLALTRVSDGLASLRNQYADMLRLLAIAVGLVLLIACANLASLLLARAAAREREMAVRTALGAGRGRIVRQVLTESLLLAVLGAALGAVFAYWGASALAEFLSSNSWVRLDLHVAPDWRVLGFAAGLAAVTGVLFGLAPALRATRLDPAPALKQMASGGAVSGQRGGRMAPALVVAQVALAMLVLVGAGLLVRTVRNLRGEDVGFDTRNLLLFSMDPRLSGYSDSRIRDLNRDLQARLRMLPGVRAVSYAGDLLLSGNHWWGDIWTTGETKPCDADMFAVGPEFFTTMGLPLLLGRPIQAVDFQKPEPPSTYAVAVVNRIFAQRFFPGQDPIGQRIRLFKGTNPPTEVVGVVGDAKYYSLRASVQPTLYIPVDPGYTVFELRTGLDPQTLVPSVRAVAARLAPTVPIFDGKTQAQQIDQTLAQDRLEANLSSLFGLLALLLAAIGLYGLLAYEVTRRTREIGIRMALGARQADVLRQVTARGVALAATGAAVGVAAALVLTRYLASVLYGVKASDPVTYAGIAILLVLVARAACYLPARRAARVDPMTALREE